MLTPEITDDTPTSDSEPHLAPTTSDEHVQGMVPGRRRRRFQVERVFMRLIATGGIIGIDVAVGAIMVNKAVAGWIVGLVVGLVSVFLAALLWSSREL